MWLWSESSMFEELEMCFCCPVQSLTMWVCWLCVWKSITAEPSSIIQLSHCLAKISNWLWSNWLNLNPTKRMLETGGQAVFWWCCHICMHWQSLLPKIKLVYSLRAFLDSFDSWCTNLLQCQKSIFPSVIGKGTLYLTLAILLIQLTHSVLENICES